MISGMKVLKLAYLAGAITDFLVFLLMIFPSLATIFWGFREFDDKYYFAMGMGAALMLGWTMLLLWAYQQPIERRFVALLTIIVIIGIAATNMIMLNRGTFTITERLPTFIILIILITLFSYGYMNTRPEK
jgi:hypothetical protein